MPADDVISCPACRHLLRVPPDWLGTPVQCPECRVKFRAPTRGPDGELAGAELLPDAAATPGPTRARTRPDMMLMLPAFGLLLTGVVGVLVDGYQFARFSLDKDAAVAGLVDQMAQLRKFGLFADDPPGDAVRDKLDADRAADALPGLRAILGVFTAVSAGAFLGGLSIVLRWNRTLALVGCGLAAVNLPGFCCLPGAVFGLWAMLLLFTVEGREHFRTSV